MCMRTSHILGCSLHMLFASVRISETTLIIIILVNYGKCPTSRMSTSPRITHRLFWLLTAVKTFAQGCFVIRVCPFQEWQSPSGMVLPSRNVNYCSLTLSALYRTTDNSVWTNVAQLTLNYFYHSIVLLRGFWRNRHRRWLLFHFICSEWDMAIIKIFFFW